MFPVHDAPRRLRHWFGPTQALVASFATAALLGGWLLTVPAASVGAPLSFVDGLFTATSAVCVTGLVVVDTGHALTPFGQGVVLILIQLGGLGIMTFSSIVLLALGRRLSFRGQSLVETTFGRAPARRPSQVIGRVILFTVVLEAAGALLLFGGLYRYEPWPQAIYSAVFHAVSAFCNAGFSLYTDSLMGFRGDWRILLPVMALIVTGGIGFAVLEELASTFFRRRRGQPVRLQLHTRASLLYSTGLIAAGALAMGLCEAGNSLAGLPGTQRVAAALFQSVTARTAGFNTLDMAALTQTGLFVLVVLMFIGGGAGSCAGGIKVTTLATLVALFRSRFTGHRDVSLLRRTVPEATVGRAVAIVLSAGLCVMLAIVALLISETGATSYVSGEKRFLGLLFEVVSAFGTVGLSTGVTPGLSPAGKLVIIGTMFAGRLGPLTLALAVGMRRARTRVHFAEENLMVG